MKWQSNCVELLDRGNTRKLGTRLLALRTERPGRHLAVNYLSIQGGRSSRQQRAKHARLLCYLRRSFVSPLREFWLSFGFPAQKSSKTQ